MHDLLVTGTVKARSSFEVFPALIAGAVLLATGQLNGVYAFSIGSNGALTSVSGSPFKTRSQPFAVTTDPKARFPYVANADSADVSGYRIASTGTLTKVSGSPFVTGKRPVSVAVDPTGSFLFVSDYAYTKISVESIGSNGTLTPSDRFAF